MASGTTTTAADTKETLVSKRRSTSVVWDYFGFNKEDAARRQVLVLLLLPREKNHHKASYDNCMAQMATSSVWHHQHSTQQFLACQRVSGMMPITTVTKLGLQP